MGRARLARERLAGGRQGQRRGEASGGRPRNQHMGGSVACARRGMGAVWLARAAGITARRGREDARGRDTRRTRVGVIRGCGRKTRAVANIAGGGTVGWWTPSVAP
jgi:hypothetical protein